MWNRVIGAGVSLVGVGIRNSKGQATIFVVPPAPTFVFRL